ncbi:hypothetical protein DAI22_04g063450 [Oryza sativa Japonica Group]|nr:hypothetical protein DAI22_04g063450 [Oryza sativa Japonica Group]
MLRLDSKRQWRRLPATVLALAPRLAAAAAASSTSAGGRQRPLTRPPGTTSSRIQRAAMPDHTANGRWFVDSI